MDVVPDRLVIEVPAVCAECGCDWQEEVWDHEVEVPEDVRTELWRKGFIVNNKRQRGEGALKLNELYDMIMGGELWNASTSR